MNIISFFNPELLENFSPLTIVDLLIVAFLAYTLFKIIKGTRAVQLLKGVGVLLAITGISYLLNLSIVHWILRTIWTGLVVALPVVFQPELRRALEKLGEGKFFHYHRLLSTRDNLAESNLNEIIQAVYQMSSQKTGALIILEGNTQLEEYLDSGIKIDGLISEALLENIFVNKTPLHDGAVIIRENRILAAACVLPLTERKNLSQELGTRHRAAIGASEVSDSLVIIVSEETGMVSLAQEGVLYRDLTQEELTLRLQELFQNSKSESFDLSSLLPKWLKKR